FHARRWDCGADAVTWNVNVGVPVLTIAQTFTGTLPGCCRIFWMFTTGTVLSIMTLAKRPASAAVPISDAALCAENSLILILLRPLGLAVVSKSSPSQ